jgi:hypothetical protein
MFVRNVARGGSEKLEHSYVGKYEVQTTLFRSRSGW